VFLEAFYSRTLRFDDAFLMVLSVERAVLFWFMEFMVFYDWKSLDLMERGGTMEDCPIF